MHQVLDVQKWADVMQTADHVGETFDNVRVITAKGEYVTVAYGAAVEALQQGGVSVTPENVSMAVKRMIASGKVHVHEYIEVDDEGISACVDVECIDADEVTWRVMDMMSKALSALDGAKGTVRFGHPLHFTLAEVPWVISADFASPPSVHA